MRNIIDYINEGLFDIDDNISMASPQGWVAENITDSKGRPIDEKYVIVDDYGNVVLNLRNEHEVHIKAEPPFKLVVNCAGVVLDKIKDFTNLEFPEFNDFGSITFARYKNVKLNIPQNLLYDVQYTFEDCKKCEFSFPNSNDGISFLDVEECQDIKINNVKELSHLVLDECQNIDFKDLQIASNLNITSCNFTNPVLNAPKLTIIANVRSTYSIFDHSLPIIDICNRWDSIGCRYSGFDLFDNKDKKSMLKLSQDEFLDTKPGNFAGTVWADRTSPSMKSKSEIKRYFPNSK